MTDGYAERRREYVAQIRNSFETEEKRDISYDTKDVPETSFSFSKLSFLAAFCIFGLFLYLKFTGAEIYGYHAEDITEIISDNHYYTKLQEYTGIYQETLDTKNADTGVTE